MERFLGNGGSVVMVCFFCVLESLWCCLFCIISIC